MSTPSRILCPTDFSESSLAGIERSAEFAQKLDADVTLLHVIDRGKLAPTLPPGATSTPEVAAALSWMNTIRLSRTTARETLERIAKTYFPTGTSVGSIVAVGAPANEIVAASEKLNADIIVMSTHSAGWWGRWLLGSVSQRVVRASGCDVLTVHHSDTCGQKRPRSSLR